MRCVALGRVSKAADDALAPSSADLHTNLQNLQRPLKQLGRASPYVIGALKLMLTAPFSIENVPKVVRGDYLNVSLTRRPDAVGASTTASCRVPASRACCAHSSRRGAATRRR